MKGPFCTRIVLAVVVMTLHAVAFAGQSAGEPAGVVVAVVEPRATALGSGSLGYSVSLGERKLQTVPTILDGLAQARGKRLAILIHEDVPIGTAPAIVSMASKAGYLDYAVFIFDRKRRGMAMVPEFKWVGYSTSPVVVANLFR